MDRRQAIALLTSVPALATISKADLKPTDVLVVEVDRHITMEAADRIKALMEQVWPGQEVVVLEKGMSLKVVSQQGKPSA